MSENKIDNMMFLRILFIIRYVGFWSVRAQQNCAEDYFMSEKSLSLLAMGRLM